MAIKLATRQIGRIQSLKLRFAKIAKTRQYTEATILQLHMEWQAILQARGFERSFQAWMEAFPELYPLPLTLPDVTFLHDVEQLLKHHTNALVSEQLQRQQQHAKYMRQLDIKKYGKQQAFQAIRPTNPGLVQIVRTEKRMKATKIQEAAWGLIMLRLEEKYDIDLTIPVYIDGQPAQIVSYEFPIIELNPHDPIDEIPTALEITQFTHTADPQEVATALQTHWGQYWQRDPLHDVDNTNVWQEFHAFQQQIPELPQMDIQQTDLTIWNKAIKGLKSKSARGVCSWFPDELKSLPDPCIQALANVMAGMVPDGFPDWFAAWNASIQRCTRCWSVDFQIWPQGRASTGYPEGDAWSVVAMLATNAYWVHHAEKITPRICAFADNWSYSTENPSDHHTLIPLLERLTQSLRLKCSRRD